MRSNTFTILAITLIAIMFISGCADRHQAVGNDDTTPTSTGDSDTNNLIFGEVSDTVAREMGTIGIEGLGSFSFNPAAVETTRPDIFKPGYFSLFDVLVHLAHTGQIELEYSFAEEMNTHVIDKLNGRGNWWYSAYYDGGWPERSVFRIDHYPYKDKMILNFTEVSGDYLEAVFETYRSEIRRRKENGGRVIIPEVLIKGRSETYTFKDVEVFAHNLRSDMFQPGLITAIDVILSLGEAGLISYDLKWYESIGTAGVVKSYWVERINEDKSAGRCGFVYEAGAEQFRFFRGNHNHIPSDVRVINAPAYLEYFWICI